MLFEGFGLHLTPAPDNVEGHPFHAKNNVNGIGIESIVDYMVLPLDPKVQELQEAYIGKVLDTVHDLPNVLYEVANEASGQDADGFEMAGQTIPGRIGDTTKWQYWVIETVKRLERERGYDARPIGMTMQFPVADIRTTNETLFASPADWISPGFDEPIDPKADMSAGPPPSHWYTDPPRGRWSQGDHRRQRPLLADGGRCALALEGIHPRPQPDPVRPGDHWRREAGRSVRRVPVL